MNLVPPNFSGLSILIPVYNYSIYPLVSTLIRQLQSIKYPSEIIVIDDCSVDNFRKTNKAIHSFNEVSYHELDLNIGRSAIRNQLAIKAKYKHLLFLDCDSKIEENNFIQNYINSAQHPVVIGGRNYNSNPPDRKFLLHWTVGRAKEVKTLEERQKDPYGCFMFNNIFLQKDVFLQVGLDETIKSYGHEDTKFGNILKIKEIPVVHLNNPTIHEGLDETEKFIEKTLEGISNLLILTKKGFGKEAPLFKVYQFLIKYKLAFLTTTVIFILLPLIKRNFYSRNPSLILYDFFKLYHFFKFSEK